MKLTDILSVAKQVAKETRCILETKDNSEYGWMGISLLTDKFGGCAVNLCYMIEDGRCFDWIHSENEKELNNPIELAVYATSKVIEEYSKRDLHEISNLINEEY